MSDNEMENILSRIEIISPLVPEDINLIAPLARGGQGSIRRVGNEHLGGQDHGGDGCRWIESTGESLETRKEGLVLEGVHFTHLHWCGVRHPAKRSRLLHPARIAGFAMTLKKQTGTVFLPSLIELLRIRPSGVYIQ